MPVILTISLEGRGLDYAVGLYLGRKMTIFTGEDRLSRLSPEDLEDEDFVALVRSSKPRIYADGRPCPLFSSCLEDGFELVEQHASEIIRRQSSLPGLPDFRRWWEVTVGTEGNSDHARAEGPTILTAGLLAIVLSKFGMWIAIPEEVLP